MVKGKKILAIVLSLALFTSISTYTVHAETIDGTSSIDIADQQGELVTDDLNDPNNVYTTDSTANVIGDPAKTEWFWNSAYIKSAGTTSSTGTYVEYRRWTNVANIHADWTVAISRTYTVNVSGSAGFSLKAIEASCGVSYSTSETVTDTCHCTVDPHVTIHLLVAPIYTVFKFNIMQPNFFGSGYHVGSSGRLSVPTGVAYYTK